MGICHTSASGRRAWARSATAPPIALPAAASCNTNPSSGPARQVRRRSVGRRGGEGAKTRAWRPLPTRHRGPGASTRRANAPRLPAAGLVIVRQPNAVSPLLSLSAQSTVGVPTPLGQVVRVAGATPETTLCWRLSSPPSGSDGAPRSKVRLGTRRRECPTNPDRPKPVRCVRASSPMHEPVLGRAAAQRGRRGGTGPWDGEARRPPPLLSCGAGEAASMMRVCPVM